MYWLVLFIVAIGNLPGLALAMLGLPGIWLMLLVALGVQLWRPETFSWWTLGTGLVLALLAELIEFLAGSIGSRSVGGTRSSAVGALIGGLVGAVAGAAFPPVIGSIIWAIVGAGLGATVGELSTGAPWRSTVNIGGAAATGKFLGILAKATLGLIVYIMLLIAAAVP